MADSVGTNVQTTYNIERDAAVSSQSLTDSETTFNLLKDAISEGLATFFSKVITIPLTA